MPVPSWVMHQVVYHPFHHVNHETMYDPIHLDNHPNIPTVSQFVAPLHPCSLLFTQCILMPSKSLPISHVPYKLHFFRLFQLNIWQ